MENNTSKNNTDFLKKIVQFEKITISKDKPFIGYLKTLKLLFYLTGMFIFLTYSMINKDKIRPTVLEKKSIFRIMINN